MKNKGFNIGLAMNSRIEDAVQTTGRTLADILAEIAEESFDFIQYEIERRGIKNEYQFVGMMRELGGYSSIIRNRIGLEPDPEANRIGMATNPAYWLWKAKMDRIGQIHETVQIKCMNERIKAEANYDN